MKKTKERWKQFVKTLRLKLPTTLVMALLWLVLGWLRSFGVHSILLFPLHFLTGALAGLDGGSFVGGTVGKAVLLIIVSNFMQSLITARGSLGARLKIGFLTVRSSLLKKIPQYLNIKQLFTKEYRKLPLNGLGFGMALLGYSFLTGNGSLQNSFVCVLLFTQFGGALISKRGFIITAANRLLSFLGLRSVDRDMVNRLVGGNALGYFAATLWAACFDAVGAAGIIGLAITAASLFCLIVLSVRQRKGAAA